MRVKNFVAATNSLRYSALVFCGVQHAVMYTRSLAVIRSAERNVRHSVLSSKRDH